MPLVEKLAEHLTAIDEAHDNQVGHVSQALLFLLTFPDELCTRTRTRRHHSNSFVQFLASRYYWLGPFEGDGRCSELGN